jgi:SAM-dependent methyltransferase
MVSKGWISIVVPGGDVLESTRSPRCWARAGLRAGGAAAGKPMDNASNDRSCPICGGRQREVVASILLAPSDFAEAPVIEVGACRECGMGFTTRVPDQPAVDASYAAHSKYAVHVPKPPATGDAPTSAFEARGEPEWDLARARDTAALLRGLCAPDAPSLDIGCATGALLAALEDVGFDNLFGLEPSPEAVRAAAASTRATVYAGSAFAPPPGLPIMQLVTLSHVLEHVADVHGVLGAVSRLMAEGALLYIEVPDATRYSDHVVAPYQDFNTEHVNHFSPRLLDRAVRGHGFDSVLLEQKTIRCSPTDPYPAVFGVWRRRTAGAGVTERAGRDDALVDGLRRYAALSAARMLEIEAQLSAQLQAGDPVVVWGAGELLLKLIANSVLGRCSIRAIVDASPSKQGRQIHGVTITAPSALEPGSMPIVVTSLVHRDSILAALRARFGQAQKIVTLE